MLELLEKPLDWGVKDSSIGMRLCMAALVAAGVFVGTKRCRMGGLSSGERPGGCGVGVSVWVRPRDYARGMRAGGVGLFL